MSPLFHGHYTTLQEKQDLTWALLNPRLTYEPQGCCVPPQITPVATYIVAALVTEEDKWYKRVPENFHLNKTNPACF